jgi:hypothetical protein
VSIHDPHNRVPPKKVRSMRVRYVFKGKGKPLPHYGSVQGMKACFDKLGIDFDEMCDIGPDDEPKPKKGGKR